MQVAEEGLRRLVLFVRMAPRIFRHPRTICFNSSRKVVVQMAFTYQTYSHAASGLSSSEKETERKKMPSSEEFRSMVLTGRWKETFFFHDRVSSGNKACKRAFGGS